MVPQQLREPRAFLHHLEPGARRGDRALDLHAVAHDAGVLHQLARPSSACSARSSPACEAVEGAAEVLALAQDGDPRQPGLEAVEHQLLVQRAVVVFRHAPFVVVIGDVERILPRPGAPFEAVWWVISRGHDAPLVSPGHTKRRPGRFDQSDVNAAGGDFVAIRQRIGEAVEPHRCRRGPSMPIRSPQVLARPP